MTNAEDDPPQPGVFMKLIYLLFSGFALVFGLLVLTFIGIALFTAYLAVMVFVIGFPLSCDSETIFGLSPWACYATSVVTWSVVGAVILKTDIIIDSLTRVVVKIVGAERSPLTNQENRYE